MAKFMPDESDPQQSASGDTNIKGAKKVLEALGIASTTLLPAGAVIRGGILFYKGLRGVAAIKKARAAIAASRPKPVTPRAKAGDNKPSSSAAVTKKPEGAVKKPGTQVTRTDRVIDADAPKTMRNITPPRTGPRRLQGSGTVPSGRLASTTKTATAISSLPKPPKLPTTKDPIIPKSAKAEERKTIKDPKVLPKRKPKPKRVDLGTVTARKVTPEAPRKREPVDRKEPVKLKVLDAGKNTGFGPNASTFVGGPEERAVMMKYYGGTGKAAAKAAQEGKQGKLKELGMDSLQKELQVARKKRFEREQKKMRKGGAVKKAIGSMDYRQGGTLISVQDRRRMK